MGSRRDWRYYCTVYLARVTAADDAPLAIKYLDRAEAELLALIAILTQEGNADA